MKTNLRRNDLDWLRVLAILAVFVFHSGRFFDLGGWHVKNPTTYFGVQVWITFLANWLMPVVFVISGASLFYALGSRGTWKFVEDKVQRLFVPLVVGAFSHVMLQVYLERITHHQFSGSFFDFIPHYFEGWYGFGGNFAWMGLHLWYLLILFVFSLILYPLLRGLRVGPGQTVLNRLGDLFALPGVVYGLAVPVAWLMVTLNPRDFIGIRDFGGWPLPIYMLFFLYGFFVISHDGLQKRIQQLRWVSLAAGVLCILAFLGFGFKHLTHSKPSLAYANEAVLPFYVMHQTVLLCVGYFVVQWQIPDLVKYVLIAASSFPVILALYEFAIRRANVLRFLFGMKPLPRTNAPAVTGEQISVTE